MIDAISLALILAMTAGSLWNIFADVRHRRRQMKALERLKEIGEEVWGKK